jgi:FtsZ-interacting cell division protein YlmF
MRDETVRSPAELDGSKSPTSTRSAQSNADELATEDLAARIAQRRNHILRQAQRTAAAVDEAMLALTLPPRTRTPPRESEPDEVRSMRLKGFPWLVALGATAAALTLAGLPPAPVALGSVPVAVLLVMRFLLHDRKSARQVPAARGPDVWTTVRISVSREDQQREIAEILREQHSVSVDLSMADRDTARNTVDFISGLCYAAGASLERTQPGVYSLTQFFPPSGAAGSGTNTAAVGVSNVDLNRDWTEPGTVVVTTFDDVKPIADRFAAGQRVLIDVREADANTRNRVHQFCLGLCAALGGRFDHLDAVTWLMTPARLVKRDQDRAA